MINRVFKRFTALMLAAVLLFSLAPTFTLTVFAATSGDLTGLSNSDIGASYTATDNGNNANWSASGNTITGNVISESGSCGSTAYETTLTLTNKKSTTATLSFDYTIAQNNGTIQVAGDAVTANGSYSGELAAGDSIKIYLKSGSTTAATSISITNLALISNVTATTTFLPGENGSYTVDGVEITAETSKTQSSTVAYTLVAAPASGYQFFGWYSVTGSKYLSSDATTTLNFDSDQTIKPVFIDASLAIFETGGARFYDLNEANTYAVANGQDKIVLTSDGTLPSGAYTISSGITLVIPFDSSNAYYTTSPSYTTTAATPMAYRTLTMAPGSSIDVQGAISVGAKHYTSSSTNNGNPTGGYGYIKMQEGSSITVKNGGNLYAWGYISGGGHITAESGASVYEYFQITDWRGGSATSSMKGKPQKVFPFSQYYVQNIEASLTLEAGASENVYTSITASNMSASATIPFVGTGAMFELSEGSTFTKTYDPTTDRIVFDVNGDISLNSITLSVLTISVNSNAYVLPINNNVTLNIHSGTTTVNQDVALQPGVQVNIDSGAELKVASGSSVYVYDQDQWGTYCNGANGVQVQFKSIAYSPTKAKTRSNADLVDVVIDVNGTLMADGYLYTTAGGADIKTSEGTGKVVLINGAGTATTTYQATQSGSTITYVDIPITSAKLHNGSQYVGTEEEYTFTGGSTAGSTYYWNSSNSKWKLEGETETVTITFDANEGEGNMDAQTVESGVDAVLTGNGFTREYYTFKEWNTAPDGSGTSYENGATVNFTEDTTLYAIWTPDTYTVTWVDEDGTELEKDENVPYGTTPEYNGETPTKEGDAQYSYTFDGWTPETSPVTSDVTYKAVYAQTVNQYTITWNNWDGTELLTEQVDYGQVPAYTGETPTREGDAEHTYSFSGWTPEIQAVTGNASYTAVFTDTINTYTVIWKNWDGTVLETDENVTYGTDPEYNSETPTKAGDAQYSYTFTGWSPAVDTVTGDITYTAVFEQTVNQYTITWSNWDGTLLKTEQVAYGETPVYSGETPTKAGDTQYSYTFTGWTPEITAVTGNAEYTAKFEQVMNTYTVTWKNADGTVLETDENVAYGTTPEYNGETPAKAEDDSATYTFTGWTPEVSTVAGNVTYTAVYEATAKVYTVTWANEDGTVLETQQVEYGKTPVYSGLTPTKADDSDYSYTFSGWEPEISIVTGNATYKATYTATELVKHTVTFNANGGEGSMEPQVFIQGRDTKLTANTFTRENYKFTGWNTAEDGSGAYYEDEGAIINLTEDLTLYAQWQIWNGWYTDTIGTTYYVEGEQPYNSQWDTIDGNTYYFDEAGYIVKGLYKTTSQDGSYEATFVFDSATGVFLSDKSGLHDVGADTYWIQNGEVVEYAGLIRIVKDDGEVNYYYFGEDSKACKATAEKNQYLVEKTNGLALPGGINYTFGEDGIIKHFPDTSINGIYFDESSSNYYYCIDGVIIANGLMLIDGSYYYARTSSGAFVCGCSYWITKTNGLLDEGIYQFDETGKIVFPEETETKNGIVEENGSLYYYENGVLTGAGLIQIGDDYYYVRTSTGEVVHGRTYWITVTNGLPVEAGQYQFADDGKMILPETEPEEPEDPEVKNGIVEEDGSLYYYVDGIRTGAGLIQIGYDYYYVRTSTGEVIHGRSYWITVTNGLPVEAGQYAFAEDGKMIR